LAQAFFSRLRKLGLVRRYGDADVRRAYRHLISLAFLPPALVRRGMAIIIQEAPVGMQGI
jgi:hypothetical protein